MSGIKMKIPALFPSVLLTILSLAERERERERERLPSYIQG
jgi:hypothetical protein